MRTPVKYVFDLKSAIASIKDMNRSATMRASDRAIGRIFSQVSDLSNLDCVAERVAVLDGLWGTRLYMESGAADQIAGCISQNAKQIVTIIENLCPDALEKSPDIVWNAAKQMLPYVLNHSANCRENYSFATKFFHWSTRHHFPSVDSKARIAINQLQRRSNVRPLIRKFSPAMGNLSYIQEYERWIYFYSDLIAGLPRDQRNQLVCADYKSQKCLEPTENSLLRILDKYFYYEGGGRGMGRI